MTVVSFVVSIKQLSVPGSSLSCQSGNENEDINYTVTIIRVHVIPNAKIDNVLGEHGEAIKIKLRAPAVEGKANTALRRFLAEKLAIPQRAIVMERGERSRDKVLRIEGLSEEEVRKQLLTTI